MMVLELMPGDDERINALAEEFAGKYIEWVEAQLNERIPAGASEMRRKLAQALVLHTSGAIVAISLASAVWSAEQAIKIDKAGGN